MTWASRFRKGQSACLLLMAAAWPWEIYQRVCATGVTLVKISGVVLIVCVVAECLLRRKWPAPRTRLELPLGLLAVACVLSWPASLDRSATASLLKAYLVYGVLFYAVAAAVRTRSEATAYLRVFSISALPAAMLAWVCSAGWAAPAFLAMSRQTGRLVTEAARAGADLRMAATSPDANQGVLPMLLSIPIVLWLWPHRRKPSGVALRLVASAFFVGALFIAVSRSSLAIAAMLAVWYLVSEAGRRKFSRKQALAAVAVTIAALALVSPYLYAVAGRSVRALTGEDASATGRLLVYLEAFRLIPDFAGIGTGLGASDEAIYRELDPARTDGLTLHSVPFKFLLETGLLGLIAYLWFFFRVFRIIDDSMCSQDPDHTDERRAFLALWITLFLVMLVQPFMRLSLFPLMLGLTLGPSAKQSQPDVPPPRSRWRYAPLALMLIIPLNYMSYQNIAHEISAFAAAVSRGVKEERDGNWDAALRYYNKAMAVSRGPKGDALSSHRYAFEAAKVAQAALLLEEANANVSFTIGLTPIAAYLTGRAEMAAQPWDAPIHLRQAIEQRSDFAEAWMLLGDALWRMPGKRAQALEAYHQAALSAPAPVNARYAQRRARMAAQVTSLLAESPTAGERMAAARILRRLGHWDRCVALAEHTLRQEEIAEAAYVLSVSAALRGDPKGQRRLLSKALALEPRHLEAARDLSLLN